MQSPYLLAFILVMLAIAAAALTMLVLRRKRGKPPLPTLPEEEASDLPALVVQTDGEGAGPRHDDTRGHGSDPAFAARPAPEGSARS
jgi:hypothetical protein